MTTSPNMPELSQIPSHPSPTQKQATLPVSNASSSFWLSDLDPVLKNHRTTADLPEYVDTIIVGSGITGATAAWELCNSSSSISKQDVLMLEAREVCSGATGRNGGHLQPLLYDTTPSIASFEIANCVAVADLIKQHDIDCEYRSVSSCRSFWTPGLLADAQSAVGRLQTAAPELAERIKWVKNQAGQEEAQVKATCEGATITEGAASLWPYKYVAWIVRRLVDEKRINLQTNTAVTKVEALGEKREDGARYRVETPRGSVVARNVLLATNAYTSFLLPQMASLIVPVRETMTALMPPESIAGQLLRHSHGLVGTGLERTTSTEYLTHRPLTERPSIKGVGHLMLGGARTTAGKLPHFGESDDSVVDEAVVDYLQALLPRTLDLGFDYAEPPPKLALERAWTGIYGQSRDGAPWVGRAPDMPAGLWLCGGYSGHGMPNATLCAKAVVEMMTLDAKQDTKDDNVNDDETSYAALVRDAKIPQSYLITKERLAKAKLIPQAAELDQKGVDPLEWIESQVGE